MVYSPVLPLLVRMEGRSCLVVGGGKVAERKISSLLEVGAHITVVSPVCTELIMSWAQSGRVTLRHREYEAGDHGEAFLIIAATDQPDVNANVIREADTRGQLVNAVSEPERGSVILPAVLRRGRLVVAVSTAGASPAAAVAIRNRIDQLLAHDAEELLDFMEWFRSEAKARVSDGVLRRQLLKQLVNDDTFSKLSEADGWQSFKQEMLHQLEEAERACASSN